MRRTYATVRRDMKHTEGLPSSPRPWWSQRTRMISTLVTESAEAIIHGIDVDQRWNDTHVTVGAAGYASHYDAVSKCHVAHGRCRSNLRLPRRVPAQNWLKLMCAIGDFQWQVAAVKDGLDRLMPLDEAKVAATVFPVGTGVTFTAAHTGELICFANDALGGCVRYSLLATRY